MARRSAVALFAALLTIAAWMSPAGGSRSPAFTLNAARSLVRSTAQATPQPVNAQPTIPRGAPRFKAVPVSQQFGSAPLLNATHPVFRGAAPGSTRRLQPPPPGGSPRTPSAPKAPRIAVYSGLNHPGISSIANAPDQLAPPDSTGAIGPANYVEMVNSQIAVWSRTDLTRVSISSLHAFIGDPSTTTPYCDPQVQWDPSAGRWLFVFLLCSATATTQEFIFGWSKTADPSDLVNGWCAFGATSGTLLFDYPKLGHNSNYVIFGGNFFNVGVSPSNPPFVTAVIAWVAKPANGVIATCPTSAPAVTAAAANPLKNGDGVTNTFTPVPVNTITGSGDGYVISAYDASGATQHKLAVWHLDASGVLHQDADLTVANFAPPFNAPQVNGSYPIDTLDGRLTQAVGDPTTGIWTQHTINGPGGRSVVRWYEITVAGSVASLAQEGEITSATDFVFNGAISPRFDALGAAVFYNRSSATIDPVIAGQDRLSSTPLGTMEPGETVLAGSSAADVDGSCNFGGSGSCRWGDYSGASPDPVHTNVVWGTNEFITPTPSGPTYPAWADENFAVLFVGTPTNVTAVAGDNAASVRWTPARSDPGTPITTYTVTTYSGASVVKTTTVPGQSSSVIITGLSEGVAYTFTVIANSADGSSPESAHSNAVTPTTRAAVQAPPAPIPTRDPAPPAPPAPTPTGR